MTGPAGNRDIRWAQGQAAGTAAVARLVRLNEPGRLSLAGAYALGYGALGFAQHEGDADDWYDLVDPLDALVLGATFPSRFASEYEFGNTRDAWLRMLRGTVHWKGVEAFVHLVMRASGEFDRPVDDGELMLLVAGRVEAAHLDQRKIPRQLLPATALATSRVAAGPSPAFILPAAPADAEHLVARFWASTEPDVELAHDGTVVDALREGVHRLRLAGLDPRVDAVALLPALYLALVASDGELLSEAGQRADAWAAGVDEDSPLTGVLDTIIVGCWQGLTSDEIIGRLHGLEAFGQPVEARDRRWHSMPGAGLQALAFELGYTQVITRERKTMRMDASMSAMMRTQLGLFEAKFGRPPGPDDPVFFDPDADEPTPLTRIDLEHHSIDMLQALGIAPAWIYANQHTDGLMPGLDGTFRSDADRHEWDETVARYLRTHPGELVDHREQLRKLRTGAAAASLGMAAHSPEYATSLIERMRDSASEPYSDAGLVRAMLAPMAGELLEALADRDDVREAAREHARAWGGTVLADAVNDALDGDPDQADPAVLLAAFTAARSMPDHDEDDGDEFGIDIDLESEGACEELVSHILEHGEPDAPRDVLESLAGMDNDDSGRMMALLTAKAMGYLVSFKDAGVTPAQLDAAVTWIGDDFGAPYAGPTAIVAALAGHPDSQKFIEEQLNVQAPTVAHLVEMLDADFFPAMIWLCTGLVATLGNGDVAWLRKHRSAT